MGIRERGYVSIIREIYPYPPTHSAVERVGDRLTTCPPYHHNTMSPYHHTTMHIDMSVCRYVDMSVCRYDDMSWSICRYVSSVCRYVDILSICLYVGMTVCRYVDMSTWRYDDMSICRYVGHVGMSICRYVVVDMSICRFGKTICRYPVYMSICRMSVCRYIDMSICRYVDPRTKDQVLLSGGQAWYTQSHSLRLHRTPHQMPHFPLT